MRKVRHLLYQQHTLNSLHETYLDCMVFHINLLMLQIYFATFCLLKQQKSKSRPTHSGTFHCPGMDLTGTRDIFSHSGTVPGSPEQLVTLGCLTTAVVGLGAPPSRFLYVAPYKFFND